MNSQDAWSLVKEHSRSDNLLRHSTAVEAVMRAYAKHFGENEEIWGMAGMLHDFDWDICPTPDQHPEFGANILREKGCSDEIIRAVLSHGNHTGISRETTMEKALFAVDELSGFITAVGLVRPTKSLEDVDPKVVKRKMKDKGFAKSINREDIVNGATDLGVDLDQHINFVINALKPVSNSLGLKRGGDQIG